MRRSYKRLLTLFIVMVIIGMAGAAGHMIAQNEPRIIQPEAEKNAAAAGANEARISKDAHVEWTYRYSMCRHPIDETLPVEKSMVGLSFSQLKEKYPHIRIVSFDTHVLELEKSFACYCPSHYILKKSGDVLAVFRTRKGTEEQDRVRVIDAMFIDVKPDERSVLIYGKVFSSMADIDAYIERTTNSEENKTTGKMPH